MGTQSTRTQTINFTGDATATQSNAALMNPASPAVSELVSLIAGPNQVNVPSGGATAVAVTIVPPAGNVVPITLQGIASDAGILLHPTDPSTIAIGSTVFSFTLTVPAPLPGVRLIWS